MPDRSNGYEAIAPDFIARRGNVESRSTGIGTKEVSLWAQSLPRGAAVLDLGCGPGIPLTEILVRQGLEVFAIDAAPSFVAAFRQNLPGVPVACEAVMESDFFGRSFDAVLAWGLMFLLPTDEQVRLIGRIAERLEPGGRLLFTAPAEPVSWADAMTGRESRSLGLEAYHRQLAAAGLHLVRDYEGEGQNHHYEAVKPADGFA